jgi:membrane associated rhomboid family serine protease
MFPFRDENLTQRTPFVTYAVIALNVAAWLLVQQAGTEYGVASSVCNYGLIPGELTGQVEPGARFDMGEGLVCVADPGRQVSHLVSSMFLHGSWMHLLGNMWFLWIFGNNVEDAMTRPRFIAFYLISGLTAALAQILTNPASNIPMVGASGAISGVMGAYLILYPTVRVHTLVPLGFFLTTIALPAWVMLLYWAFIQTASGLVSLVGPESGGVAFWAHIGGFAAGVILVKIFSVPSHIEAHKARHWHPRRALWR